MANEDEPESLGNQSGGLAAVWGESPGSVDRQELIALLRADVREGTVRFRIKVPHWTKAPASGGENTALEEEVGRGR